MNNALDTGSPAPSQSARSAQGSSDQATKSWVWQHFVRLPGQDKATCQVPGPSGGHCLASFSHNRAHGTSGLARHLLNAHLLTAPCAPSESGLTTHFMPATAETKELTVESLKDAIVKLVVRRNLPFQIAEYPEFRDLLELCNPIARDMCVGADMIRDTVLKTFVDGKSYCI